MFLVPLLHHLLDTGMPDSWHDYFL
jgi:hypothetical protein